LINNILHVSHDTFYTCLNIHMVDLLKLIPKDKREEAMKLLEKHEKSVVDKVSKTAACMIKEHLGSADKPIRGIKITARDILRRGLEDKKGLLDKFFLWNSVESFRKVFDNNMKDIKDAKSWIKGFKGIDWIWIRTIPTQKVPDLYKNLFLLWSSKGKNCIYFGVRSSAISEHDDSYSKDEYHTVDVLWAVPIAKLKRFIRHYDAWKIKHWLLYPDFITEVWRIWLPNRDDILDALLEMYK